jgi:hypothetical protein
MCEIARSIRLIIGSFSRCVARQVGAAMNAVSHWIQQRFSAFADVPYATQFTRQQWQDTWADLPKAKTLRIQRPVVRSPLPLMLIKALLLRRSWNRNHVHLLGGRVGRSVVRKMTDDPGSIR